MTVREALTAFLDDRKPTWAPATQRSWHYRAIKFSRFNRFGSKQINEITLADILAWSNHRLTEAGPAKVTADRLNIRAFLAWCDSKHYIPINPCELHKLPDIEIPARSRKFLSRDQHMKMIRWLSANRKQQKYPWWEYACWTGWETGLRISDVCLMEWAQFNLDEGLLTVIPHKTRRKKKHEIVIPVEGEYLAFMRNLRDNPLLPWHKASQYVSPELQVLYTQDSRRLHEQFVAVRNWAGVSDITFHCYRHSFFTRLVNAGVSPMVICSLTGVCLDTIMNYTTVATNPKREALNAIREAMLEIKPVTVQAPPPLSVVQAV